MKKGICQKNVFDIRALNFMHVLYTHKKRQAPVRANKAVSGGVWILVWGLIFPERTCFRWKKPKIVEFRPSLARRVTKLTKSVVLCKKSPKKGVPKPPLENPKNLVRPPRRPISAEDLWKAICRS